MPSVGETIAVALDTRSDVWMKYRNNQGKESARRVTPLEWKGSDSFLALCLESQQELTFSVRNILECSWVPNSSQEPPLQLEADQLPAPTLRHLPSVPQRKVELVPMPGADAAGTFSEVKDGQQWSRSARYYRACLVVENRQQYVIDRKAFFPLPRPAPQIRIASCKATVCSSFRASTSTSRHRWPDSFDQMITTARSSFVWDFHCSCWTEAELHR